MSEKIQIKAGQNVKAKVDGKEIGPIYCVQIEGEGEKKFAVLQGKDEIRVPVGDCVPA